MQEFVEIKVGENSSVIGAVQDFMKEKEIRMLVPVAASGSIKNFAIATFGKGCRIHKDASGRPYEISAVSGKVHTLKDGFLWNLSIVVRGNGTGPVHGVLQDAVAAGPVELKFRKVNLQQIRIA